MTKQRLEALSDGVFAVVITLLIFGVHVAPGPLRLASLKAMLPSALAFVLSFAITGVYWVSHHMMLHYMDAVDRRLLWSNLLLLLFIVFLPVPTEMLSAHAENPLALACYGTNLIAVNAAGLLLWLHGTAIRSDGRLPHRLNRLVITVHSTPAIVYAAAIGFGFVSPVVSVILFALVPAFFILPHPWLDRWMIEASRSN